MPDQDPPDAYDPIDFVTMGMFIIGLFTLLFPLSD